MIREIVAVYDSAAEVYGSPVFVGSVGLAIRSFGDEVNRAAEDNQMHRHPGDFSLYHLGSFDDSTGKFVFPEVPRLLVRGVDVVRKET